MKKLIKFMLIGVVILTLFVTGSMFLLTKMIKPDTFKDQLTRSVYLKTGRQLTINGNIGLSVFPHLGVIVRDVSLDNAAAFTDQEKEFARASKIEVQVQALPLFRGKVMIGKFVFKDFDLKLTRNESGINNWDDLIQETPSRQSKDAGGEGPLPELYISNVDIENATVDFNDQQLQKRFILSGLHLSSQGINFNGDAFVVNANGKLSSSDPKVVGDFIFSGKIILDWQKKIYAIKGMKTSGNVIGDVFKKSANFGLNADTVVDIGKQEINIDNLRIQLASMVATGHMQATNIIYAPNVVGNLEVATFDPSPLLRVFGIETATVMRKNGATTQTPPIKQEANASNSASVPALESAALKVSLQTTSKFLKIPNLELHLNDTILLGSASYSHFGDKLVVFDFNANKLDLDRYKTLSSGAAGTSGDTVQVNVASSDASASDTTAQAVRHAVGNKAKLRRSGKGIKVGAKAEINVATKKTRAFHAKGQVGKVSLKSQIFSALREISLNGDLRIQDLKVANMHFYDVNTEISDNGGNIEFNPFDCKFYQGTIRGQFGIDLRRNVPEFNLLANVANITIYPLVKDFANIEKLRGVASLKVKLTTSGDSVTALLKNLNGTSTIRIVKGIFYGLDIHYQIERVKALLNNREVAAKESQPPQSVFTLLTGDFKVMNGVANTNNLMLQSPDFNVNGKGSADLSTQNLDMELDATYPEHRDFYLPIRVTGYFTAPNIKPDVEAFMGHMMQKTLTDKISKELGRDNNKNIKIDAGEIVKSLKIKDKTIQRLLGQ